MKMGKYDESRFLKASDLEDGRDYTLVIDNITEETVKDRGGNDKTFPVLWFRGRQKGFGLSAKINRSMVVHNFGSDETDDYIGRKLTLYRTTTEFKGEIHPCVRIRNKDDKGAARAAADAANDLPDDWGGEEPPF